MHIHMTMIVPINGSVLQQEPEFRTLISTLLNLQNLSIHSSYLPYLFASPWWHWNWKWNLYTGFGFLLILPSKIRRECPFEGLWQPKPSVINCPSFETLYTSNWSIQFRFSYIHSPPSISIADFMPSKSLPHLETASVDLLLRFKPWNSKFINSVYVPWVSKFIRRLCNVRVLSLSCFSILVLLYLCRFTINLFYLGN